MTGSDEAKYKAALEFHARGRPGKVSMRPTKPLATQYDLTLAYSPGVAAPCLAIAKDKNKSYDYTAKGNIVAVISNGTAVLGLGDLGADGAKPVMEGKAVLFKRFADIDGFDLEVDTKDVDQFINAVRYLGPSFGGINLEDIKAPECFIIEQRLRELMDIPIFHDDQHGTAIIALAGMINAAHITGRKITDTRVVINGAGAAGVACAELLKAYGVPHDNVILCDTKGVIFKGRTQGMNQWKSAHAIETKARTLAEALKGADCFMGLSAKDAVTQDMVRGMAARPLIFAMANPDPEISPEDVEAVRGDAIVATGRSDYPNQINNVLGFPYVFRGALDTRATVINDAMKIAAAKALADLAREDVPDEVAAAYGGRRLQFGPKYIVPLPFDPRLILRIPTAVAKAAMDSGVARKPIADWAAYQAELRARLDPTSRQVQPMLATAVGKATRMAFCEGEEERVIRAALAYRDEGYGRPILIGREDRIRETLVRIGHDADEKGIEIHNAARSSHNERYVEFLHARLARSGYLRRDCQRLVHGDRNVFGSCMVAMGHADALITGTTRSYSVSYSEIRRVLDPRPGRSVFGLTLIMTRDRTVFVADTTVHETPTSEQLAEIAAQTAATAKRLGHEPRVALVSFSSFGNPVHHGTERIKKAVEILDAQRRIEFEYDGEMAPDAALNPEVMKLYPHSRLKGPANILIMPGLHSANISVKLMQELGGSHVIGPLLVGLQRPAQIVGLGATVADIVTVAALTTHEAFA
ncbi:MAG: NADP-dependent malic enzyme [Alphaproteobacteria bacterium]|nr:NADP-dependent malic enzyme [Alphaproteobacteria bacterium]